MSLEGIGEPYFWEVVKKLFEDYNFLPLGTVRTIDSIVSDRMVFIEVEDTMFELYSAVNQLIMIAKLSRLYNAGFLAIVPKPIRPYEAPVVISYYFWRISREIDFGSRELWVVSYKKDLKVLRIKTVADSWIDWLKPRAHVEKTEIPITDRSHLREYIHLKLVPMIDDL